MSSKYFTDALPSGSKILWFEILKVLGKGGFGITYLGKDTNQDQLVAIKEYLPTSFASRTEDHQVQPNSPADKEKFDWGLERFLKEAQTLARFRHSAIVRVVSFFRDANTAYMVMEYVEGQGMDDLLKRRKTFSEEELRKFLPPILDGLEVLHDANFIHRDLKPPNILIRQDDSPVILDFGSARQSVGDDMTSLLSLGYSPFEQYDSSGDRQGPWSDIYAMGGVLYRCISGRKPADAAMRIAARLRNTEDPMKPAVEMGKGRYGEALLSAIDKALEVLETDRPQSIREWRTMLGIEVTAKKTVSKGVLNRNASPVAVEPGKEEVKRKKSSWRSFIASINEFSTQSAPVAASVSPPTPRPEPPDPRQDLSLQDKSETQAHPKPQSEGLPPLGVQKAPPPPSPPQKVISRKVVPNPVPKDPPPQAVVSKSKEMGAANPIVVAKKPLEPVTRLEFVWIPEGSFTMGSNSDEKGRDPDEGPPHTVRISGFWMAKTLVTWEAWNRVMGEYPPGIYDPQMASHPVERVSFYMVQKYLERIDKRAKGEKQFHLPTEAQWEYAARAGTHTMFPFEGRELEEYSWVRSNSQEKTHPVASKKPNALGLYDMIGNVWEWVSDGYDADYYASSPDHDPKGPKESDRRQVRGGCWRSSPRECRSANRQPVSLKMVSNMIGFRVVMEK